MRPPSRGTILIVLADLLPALAPLLADWKESHMFSKWWPPHACFHGVVTVSMTGLLSCAALWLLWPHPDLAVTVAAAIPLAFWGSFFLAPLVPGTAVEDPRHPIPRIAGVPANLLAAGPPLLTSSLGWYLDRQVHPRDGARKHGPRGANAPGACGRSQALRTRQ